MKRRAIAIGALAAAGVLVGGVIALRSSEREAASRAATIVPGAPAPDVTLQLHDGTEVLLSSLRPSQVLLYFYPKDDTPG